MAATALRLLALTAAATCVAVHAQTLYRTYTFNEAQKQRVITAHNDLRRREPAANMQEMVWDDSLAYLARDHASRCSAWHRAASERQGYGYGYIGENIWWSTETYLRGNLESIIRDFYSEKPFYHFATTWCQPGQMCGHYTQVVWSDSCAVGCGASYCDGILYGRGITHGHIITCNYGPGGNKFYTQPYVVGPSCSACPGACNNGLCAPQCSGARFGSRPQLPAATTAPQPVFAVTAAPKPTKPLQSRILGNGCEDYNTRCTYWATTGECERNPSYMKGQCGRACNNCGGADAIEPPPPPPPAPQTPTNAPTTGNRECVDRHLLCPYWRTLNECTINPWYMESNCYRSCFAEACGESLNYQLPNNDQCTDEAGQCAFWAGVGECDANPHYMRWKCRRACGQC